MPVKLRDMNQLVKDLESRRDHLTRETAELPAWLLQSVDDKLTEFVNVIHRILETDFHLDDEGDIEKARRLLKETNEKVRL
jgi:hypothetical protein